LAQHIHATVTIDGEKISPFSNISITQDIQHHHSFEVVYSVDAFDNTSFDVLQKSKNYIGKKIVIQFGVLIFEKKLPDNEFVGLIMQVGVSRSGNGEKNIVIRGQSPTILMDGLGQCKSFTKKNLKGIADGLLKNLPQSLSTSIQPMFSGTIPYVVQYNESNYLFLQRMAARYGEWCYYDGRKLVFGKLPRVQEINLPFGENLFDLDFSLRMLPVNTLGIAYNYMESKAYECKSEGASVSDLDDFGKFVLDQSSKVLVQEPVFNTGELVEKQKELEQMVEHQKSATAREMIVASGSSDNPYFNTGSIINITGELVNEHDYGKLIVTSVTHRISGSYSYENHFTAIPSENQSPPQPAIRIPQGNNQPALITDNADPDGMGRVKAKFYWQKDGETTPWIRLSSTMAGKGKNGVQGFHFIPEIGDEVMIGFEDNNNDKPFVLGSMYHKKVAPSEWKDSNNNVKVIRTRNGNQIYLVDKDGKEEIKILNKDVGNPTNIISLSMEGNGKITIETKGDLILKAKNINMTATDEIKMKSGKSTDIKAKDLSVDADTDLKMKGKDVGVTANAGIKLKAKEASLESTNVKIKASAKLDIEGAKAGIKSQMLQIDGGAMATVKAGIVQIN
jgi:type VI secretion system secreted protein VgrG